MEPPSVDEQGWAIGRVEPVEVAEAWSLLSPEAEGRFDVARWRHAARTFFRAELEVAPPKTYASGAVPLADAGIVAVRGPGVPETAVRVITVPIERAPHVRVAADAGVAAIGGAGMDAVVARGRRLWQVLARVDDGGDARAPLLCAAVLATVLLAPVVPPGGGSIFGVKGARLRLAELGFRI